eukprot:CAMPEP_0206194344 /NCGR_PEP_ID=MMETSP0166-20121206/7138_1 /ASSEMBLY_ACC=CAM_ASM_000260 /TAXON_ID=95228 /ORGANISM="Vannella robusta, Strain DIVA3 518/3/11/1/6" /LENGTH=129 /DNA_ID=CAMNT_0053611293 /DNA_START=114 /DNA_END=499 /DNA_ORIENTATION=+
MGNHHSGEKFAAHLIAMVENEEYAQNRSKQRENMKVVFDEIDKNSSGTIEKAEIQQLFDVVIEGYHRAAEKVLAKDLPDHKEIEPKEVAALFKEADAEHNKKLPFHEFMVLVDKLCEILIEGKNIENLG